MNRENLTKLADGLAALPAEYKHFDMSDFFQPLHVGKNVSSFGGYIDGENIAEDAVNITNVCNAVACAVGHGPAMGIPIPDSCIMHNRKMYVDQGNNIHITQVDWDKYSEEMLIDNETNPREWLWCFGGNWSTVDNTPQGAAKRIRFLLDHGVPGDFADDDDDLDTYVMPN